MSKRHIAPRYARRSVGFVKVHLKGYWLGSIWVKKIGSKKYWLPGWDEDIDEKDISCVVTNSKIPPTYPKRKVRTLWPTQRVFFRDALATGAYVRRKR